MDETLDRIAGAILWLPMFIWRCLWELIIRYALRLQTIICHSQYAEVVENGGNIAVLEQWDDARVEIHRSNFRSGSGPASVEEFVELFPVGKVLDANSDVYKKITRPVQTGEKGLATKVRYGLCFVAAAAIALWQRAFQYAVFAWDSIIDWSLWGKWKALCYRAKIWNTSIGAFHRLCDRVVAYHDRRGAEAKASEGEFYPDGLRGELEYFIDCAREWSLAIFFFALYHSVALFLSVLRFVLQVDLKELEERA